MIIIKIEEKTILRLATHKAYYVAIAMFCAEKSNNPFWQGFSSRIVIFMVNIEI